MQGSRPGGLDLRPGFPAFCLGFLAMSFQIYLLREFSAHFYGNELVFGFVLAAWLFWGGAGSLAASRIPVRAGALPWLYSGSFLVFFLALGVLRSSRFILGYLPGELTGLVPALAFAIALGLFISFPLGLFFVVNAARLGGDASRVYLLESLGATAGGLFVHFLLIPLFSNWTGAGVLALLSAPFIAFFMSPKRKAALLFTVWAAAAAVVILDFPSQKFFWKPFTLLAAVDTPHGKLQVLQTEEQVSFYGNGLRIFSYPAPESAEEAVHFAMLQNPPAEDVLLIGGGLSGGCREILKYPRARVDYVEAEAALIEMTGRHLPAEAGRILDSPRVRLILGDGRAYLRGSAHEYDVIILMLPEPSTARLNRYYTLEFFRLARERLSPDGILSFTLPSAENYISPDLREFLRTVFGTLNDVFPEVRVVPGGHNVFLASRRPLDISSANLEERILALDIDNTFVRPGLLGARLNPLRIATLDSKIRDGSFRPNRDLVPISYYFNSILWAAQFGSVEARVLKALAGRAAVWILYLPVVLFGLYLGFASLKRRSHPTRFLPPVAAMGFTTILVEMCLLVVFQASYGYVYGKIALLLATFMAGLSAGALAGTRRRSPGIGDLLALQAGLLVLLLAVMRIWHGPAPEFLSYLILSGFGFAGGGLFVAANRLFLGEGTHPGLGYGLDLMGSFAGVLLASAVVIPLLGIISVIRALAVLNLLCFIYILSLRGVRTEPR